MSTFSFLLVACLITLASSRPEISETKATDTNVGQSGVPDERNRNPILEYLTNRNSLPPGGKREITYLQAFPSPAPTLKRTLPKKPQNFQRDPNKSPYDNFNGFIIAGRKPDIVESPVLNVNANKTKVDVVPAVATIIRTYDEHGTLRSSLTRYEPAPVDPSTRQQISWPYAGYFPVLIKDPFLTAFHALASGSGFSLSSLIEYGPDADICKKSETIQEHAGHLRRRRQIEEREEVGKRRVMAQTRTTRLTVSDPEKGLASLRIDNPETESDDVRVTVRKGGVSIAGPGGFATAYTGGTAVVGPYGTVFKSPDGVAVAGPHSRIINITDDTNLDEILTMYDAIKANKTVPQGRTDPISSFQSVKKLFSFKTNETVNFLRHGDSNKARKLLQAISGTKANYGSQSGETTLVLAPESKSEAKDNGVAISVPISRAVVYPNRNTYIVFQPLTSASAGSGGLAHAHSDLYVHDASFYQADDIEARANLVLPPLSTILMPPVRGYDQKKKKPSKPEKEEESEEENVGEEQEESNNQESSDAVAINPPPEGASVAEAKPVGLAIAGPGGVASSKPVAQAIVGPGGLAIARPVGTAVAGVDVEGSIPLGGQQQKQKQPQKKKPKQEYDIDTDTELQYVGGLSGPIGSPKPKHTPPETNYIGGLRGVVGNPIPKYENNQPASARQFNHYQFKLGEFNGKYGFLPFAPAPAAQARAFEKRMDVPTYFHGMIGVNGNNNMPASVYPLTYY